jgi:tripartite-type tricarboxylate transporter receptor subunit TctC
MAAAEFPEQTIRMIIPWKPGGGTDAIGRGLQPAFEEAAGQSLIIDNISGAGTVSGTLQMLKAKPDGYTILMNGSTDVAAPLTFKDDLPYTLDDMRFVGGFFFSPTWVISHADRGYSDLNDFLEAAQQSGGVTLGVAGSAGAQMIMAASIKGVTGYDITLVPYSGGADLKKAILGNQVDAGVIHAPVMLGDAKGGIINVLGAGGSLDALTWEEARGKPTLQDVGIDVEVGVTRGVFAPKDTPDEVIARLEQILEQAAKSDHFAEFGQGFGFAPTWIPAADFEAQVKGELEAFNQIKADHIDGS